MCTAWKQGLSPGSFFIFLFFFFFQLCVHFSLVNAWLCFLNGFRSDLARSYLLYFWLSVFSLLGKAARFTSSERGSWAHCKLFMWEGALLVLSRVDYVPGEPDSNTGNVNGLSSFFFWLHDGKPASSLENLLSFISDEPSSSLEEGDEGHCNFLVWDFLGQLQPFCFPG